MFSDGTGTSAAFNFPSGLTIDASDNIYVAEATRVRKITPAAVVTSINVTAATGIYAVAVDASGNIFSADGLKNAIFKTTPAGVTTLFAGNGNAGSANGSDISATFNNPIGLTIDKTGNLYVVDQVSNLIRKVTPAGVVSTIAGSGSPGAADGKGTAASFNTPTGIAVDASGNLYVADTYNHKIRKITTDGTVTTVAGRGVQGSTDGLTSVATFYSPRGVAVDASGNIFVSEFAKVREITFQ
jgi:sugar lactone lactonase YvrE